MKKYFLFLIVLPSLVIGHWILDISPGYAAMRSADGSIVIPSLTIPGGGAADLHDAGNTIHLQIMTGQTVIGRSTATGTEALLGGIYALSGTSAATSLPSSTLVEGPVILEISRESEADGSNLIISWRINRERFPALLENAPIDLYAQRVSDAVSGQFVPSGADAWVRVVHNNVSLMPSVYVVDVATRRIQYRDQVGRPPGEAYFKAVLADAVVDDSTNGLPGAIAVGKVNIAINGTSTNRGVNIISVPFCYLQLGSASVARVFGEGASSVWSEGDLIQFKYIGSPAYYSAVYTGNRWHDAARPVEDPIFNVDFRHGYEIITNTSKTVSVVGKVTSTSEVACLIYAGTGLPTGGKTLIGMIYPRAVTLNSMRLIEDGADTRDMIQYKTSALSPSYISAVVDRGIWVNAAQPGVALPSEIATLRVPFGYTFVRYGSGLTWRRRSPYE